MRRSWRGAAIVVATLASISAGCSTSGSGGSGSEDARVLPFEEVQATDFVFGADQTNPDQGVFRMTTTEPMICSIAWGETEGLGHLSNDPMMTGTGSTEHNVTLAGAQPGKRYFFRVQGSTADGQLYQSEVGSFTIPEGDTPGAADAGESHGANLALEATIAEVSSVFSDAWAAENAIDGDTATEWATAGDGDDGYLVLDLGSARGIAGVEFVTRSMTDGSAATRQFSVMVDDGSRFGPFPSGTVADGRFSVVETTGRRVRFDVESSSGGNTGAIEVRVFAPRHAPDASGPPGTFSDPMNR